MRDVGFGMGKGAFGVASGAAAPSYRCDVHETPGSCPHRLA